uniref:Uncharacterized protein n=1 Tax=viral metagenome TaxID=1070528 RepID=A0A6C0AES3_9ZZZZ
MFKFLKYGLYKECNDCLDILNSILDSTHLYLYFIKLDFTNALIEEEKTKISHRVLQEVINQNRENLLVIGECCYVPGSSKELIELYG